MNQLNYCRRADCCRACQLRQPLPGLAGGRTQRVHARPRGWAGPGDYAPATPTTTSRGFRTPRAESAWKSEWSGVALGF